MIAIDHTFEGRPVRVPIDRRSVIQIRSPIIRARLKDMLFETDKTFLLPGVMTGIRGLKSFHDEHPREQLVVSGHTDTVGDPFYNLALSRERADAVAAFLKDDVEAWMAWYAGKPHSKPWGTREDQHMLSALDDADGVPFYLGPVHGANDEPTRDAVRRFQAEHGLAVDGVAGPLTRRKLVERYMQQDGTTLPPEAHLETHGCGENHPEVQTGDQVPEARNRRVEIFMFDGPIDPPAPPPPERACPIPTGCTQYPEWVRRTILTVEFGDPLPVVVEARWEKDETPTEPVAIRVLELRGGNAASVPVTIDAGGVRLFGLSDDDGIVRVDVPVGTKTLHVRYAPRDAATMVELAIDLELAPLTDDEGVVQRLVNLGYPADVDIDYAVHAFQRDAGVTPSGVIDGPTRQALAALHDVS